MRYEKEPDSILVCWYKKAIWYRKTPVLYLAGLIIILLLEQLFPSDVRIYLNLLNFLYVVLVFIPGMAIIVRPAMYGRNGRRAFIKLVGYLLLVFGIIAFNSFVVSGLIKRGGA